MESPRKEYWSGLSLPLPGTEFPSPASPALAGRFSTTVTPGNPLFATSAQTLEFREEIFKRVCLCRTDPFT